MCNIPIYHLSFVLRYIRLQTKQISNQSCNIKISFNLFMKPNTCASCKKNTTQVTWFVEADISCSKKAQHLVKSLQHTFTLWLLATRCWAMRRHCILVFIWQNKFLITLSTLSEFKICVFVILLSIFKPKIQCYFTYSLAFLKDVEMKHNNESFETYQILRDEGFFHKALDRRGFRFSWKTTTTKVYFWR